MEGLEPKSYFGFLIKESSFVLCRLPRSSPPREEGRGPLTAGCGWLTLALPCIKAGDGNSSWPMSAAPSGARLSPSHFTATHIWPASNQKKMSHGKTDLSGVTLKGKKLGMQKTI